MPAFKRSDINEYFILKFCGFFIHLYEGIFYLKIFVHLYEGIFILKFCEFLSILERTKALASCPIINTKLVLYILSQYKEILYFHEILIAFVRSINESFYYVFLISNILYKNLTPYPGGIHKIQIISILRTLGYTNF